ncbi:MAG: rod shape-determining protein MreC [Absicoccus sp.]|uniref:Cell shape-determining protein MreC n=1 Tax=Absicoccus intestinalis TaxID=2926319 RepID=A0ABU4WK05_9FIRM|nr:MULTISPECIES: rod shape-determining protein MreC [unclassified Absicoccus]MDX8416882.1 rod shape-determining protein MreC [Absicoccus sp. CLA-KB-P134]MDY3036055.1 rod shape-determining protein MreC [Absicoccus sp.]
MRRLNHLQRVLAILIVIVLGIGTCMIGLRQQALSNMGYSAWTYIQYGLIEYPITSLANVFNDVANLWHQQDDNDYLKQELAEQKSYKTLYEEEANKNEELEKLLNVKNTNSDVKMISCSVIRRSSETWNQNITISAGSSQGVKVGMLVQSSEGMIGLVTKTQVNTSTVELLTSENLVNDIAVKISLQDGSTVEGVIQSYDANRNEYCMSLFNNDATVTSGQAVATSGQGGNYPSGIFVGTVTEIERDDSSIISKIYVKPVSNMQSFKYVMVVGNGDAS